MASQRQINANRMNALKSTGPKTVEGKEQSRKNAYKHGLSGEGVVVDEATERAIAQRTIEWRGMFHLVDPLDDWHFAELVENTVKLERARREESILIGFLSHRAQHHWDADRRIAAEELAAGISRNPRLVVRKLTLTPQGCDWLIDGWRQLLYILEDGEAWDDNQRAMYQDLAGIPHEVRHPDDAMGATPGCPESISFVKDQIANLETLRDGPVSACDEIERLAAVEGLPLKPPKGLFQIQRYISGFTRDYHKALNRLTEARRRAIQKSPPPRNHAPTLPPITQSPRPTEPTSPDDDDVFATNEPTTRETDAGQQRYSLVESLTSPPRHENRKARRARLKREGRR